MSARFFIGFGSMAAATGLLSACSVFSPKDVAMPQHVSVGRALEELACGFRRMREVQPTDKVGAVPAEMKVNLKVTVSAKDGGKLSVAPTVSGITGTAERTGESNASRENTIEITFKSLQLYLLEKAMTEHGKGFTKEKLKELLDLGKSEALFLTMATGPNGDSEARAARQAEARARKICDAYRQAEQEEDRRREEERKQAGR